jgi:transmembrane sensor
MNDNERDIQAGEWLARLDRNDPSAADLAEFDRWEAADPRNAGAYARLAATWQALDRIQSIRPSAAVPIDNDYLGGAQTDSRDPSLQEVLPYRLSRPFATRRRVSLSVAACLALAVISLGIMHLVGGPKTYSTGVGGFQRIVLEDRSAVDLNTDSEVRVALTPRLRKVELVRGEASFEVAHDASRPFVVYAGTTAVRAVGTKFNVRRLDDSVEVIVDEGKVAVGQPSLLEGKAVPVAAAIPQLSVGEAAVVGGSGVQLKHLPGTEMVRKLAWQSQMLVFDSEALIDVVTQFNRYNGRQLVIADPSLAGLEISGYFRPTNLDAFVSVLQSNFDVRIHPDGNRILLTSVRNN